MTDRLDRIEAILDRLAAQQAVTQAQVDQNARVMESSTQLIASNARAIEANSNEIAEGFAQMRRELQANLEDVTAMILSSIQDTDRQMRETDERFNTLLAEARADRQRNEQEHQAFREAIQKLLND
ncbi:MAG: hypothetical protein AAFW84_01885 [Cyanobacteria bacterium J06635_15]